MKPGEKFEFLSFAESEADGILEMHDIAMSDDPHIACMGRLVKAASFPMALAVRAEIDRVNDADDYIGMLNPLAAAIATCVYAAFDQMIPMPDIPPHVRRDTLGKLRDQMLITLDDIFKKDPRNGN